MRQKIQATGLSERREKGEARTALFKGTEASTQKSTI
jgi:hypothetical protein